ncbi:MAG: NUDIX domain-containing protein [Actinomycetota bacterium]|nr:NUDIX domain-containing protein [Actinomycetota bacterium]
MTRPFKFCPADGTRLAEPGNDSGARCPQCGRSWYHNAAPTAGAVIVDDGRALVTQRGREPEKDRFDIPGGFLDPDEDPIAGLKREMKEELALDVEVTLDDLVQMVPHRYGSEGDWVLAIGFIVRSFSGEPTPSDDVADIRWITVNEIDDVDFAWDHDRALVRKALTA